MPFSLLFCDALYCAQQNIDFLFCIVHTQADADHAGRGSAFFFLFNLIRKPEKPEYIRLRAESSLSHVDSRCVCQAGGDFGVVHTVDIKSDDPDFVADILCVAVYRDAIDREESVDRLSEQDLLVFLASSNRLRCHKQVFSKRSLLKKHR